MEREIGKINKNPTTDIVIRIDDFGDRRGLTIREYVTSDRYTGFTKSGVRILSADFKKFKEMINSIPDEEMEEKASENGNNPKSESVKVEKVDSKDQKELPDY